MSARASSRVHSSRVVIAESWRDILGTRRFVLSGLVLLAALYYYFLVYHATPVLGAAAQTVSEAAEAKDAQAQRIVVKLDSVKTAQQRLGIVDKRMPLSAANPAPSIDDILQSAAGPSDVMCSCVPSTAAAALHARNLPALAAAQALPTTAGFFKLNLTAARASLPKGAAATRASQINRSGNVAQAHAGRVLPTHSAADEVAAQLAAYNAAQRLLHPNAQYTGVLSALELEADIAMLELEADLQTQQSQQRWGSADAMEEEEAEALAPHLAPRSVDDLMRDFSAVFSDEIRLSGTATLASL